MVELPKRKVGIVSCSGEELPEGTVSRLATLKVMNELRRADTVTICLPLFLAGGEGDRAFARFYPTIAVDGCELRCAAHGTELYSGKPAASIVVRELVTEKGLPHLEGRRRLDRAGLQAMEVTAERIAGLVDELLGKQWDRQAGAFIEAPEGASALARGEGPAQETACACGSGLPAQKVQLDGQEVTLMALPFIFEQFRQAGRPSSDSMLQEMLETVKIYNAVPVGMDGPYRAMLRREYEAFCRKARAA